VKTCEQHAKVFQPGQIHFVARRRQRDDFRHAADGEPFTVEVKFQYLRFDNGSRIIAFSSNPYAMAVFGGDVGLDEFAKHPRAECFGKPRRAASPGLRSRHVVGA